MGACVCDRRRRPEPSKEESFSLCFSFFPFDFLTYLVTSSEFEILAAYEICNPFDKSSNLSLIMKNCSADRFYLFISLLITTSHWLDLISFFIIIFFLTVKSPLNLKKADSNMCISFISSLTYPLAICTIIGFG